MGTVLENCFFLNWDYRVKQKPYDARVWTFGFMEKILGETDFNYLLAPLAS